MVPRILLVNPPIYDFSAYDFWIKPYGLLRVAGMVRDRAHLSLFDFLDRFSQQHQGVERPRSDSWSTGKFISQSISKPKILESIPRHYRRYGLPRELFKEFVARHGRIDYAFIQTGMTYWYPGVKEVMDDLRTLSPRTKIILGGVYATLCPVHAATLGADLVIKGSRLKPLWTLLDLKPNFDGLPYWEGYETLRTGVLKLADGCPFRCTYCSVPQVDPNFVPRSLERSLSELQFLCRQGAKDVAFYDDALLFRSESLLVPFLSKVIDSELQINFHTPNALNARFLSEELARLMVRAGFKTFFLGFESKAYQWQRRTGGKVYSEEFARAVKNLVKAGAHTSCITAYLILGHPRGDHQDVEASMRFVHDQGVRVMLSEFSPIPDTPDGEACSDRVDLSEPLWSNKTVFPILSLGAQEVARIKGLCKSLNEKQTFNADRVPAGSTFARGENDLSLE